MNKATKGALAIGAAVVLMLGGAGSLAYWQSTAATDAANFTMGNLAVTANDDAEWTQDGEAIDPETALLIPGDTVTYTQTFDVDATGDGLLVTAEMVNHSMSTSWEGGPGHYVWLEGDVLEYIYDGVYKVTGSGTITVHADLMISSFEEGGKNGTIDVFNGDVMITQVHTLPTVPPCAC